MALKIFWYRCGRRHGNFGDVLTPLLLDYFGVRCDWAPAEIADFVGIGSICEKIPASFKGVIWTPGNLRDTHRNWFPDARVLALRGKQTIERTKCAYSSEILLGDGGLLCHLLAPRVRKRYKLGIIPHYVDENHETLKQVASRSGEICLIDICDEPHSVIRRVAQCETILSSSLHGLVLADSLHIPNRWLRAFANVIGDGFKFRDYYSVFGLERPEPLVMLPMDNLDSLLSKIVDYGRPNIHQIQKSLLDSLKDLLGVGGRASTHSSSTPDSLRDRTFSPKQKLGRAMQNYRSQPARASCTNAPSSRRRIFVIGTGRSGTCWLGDLLGTHPSIQSFVEPRPVFDLVTAIAIDPRRKRSLLESVFGEYDRLFDLAQPLHFADKTHPVLWLAEEIAARFDDSWFIAMLRHVEPTVASMLQHRGVRRWCEQWDQYPIPNRFLGITPANLEWYKRASLLERCVARWWAHQNEIFRLTPFLAERLLVVRYESLVSDPNSNLAQVAKFLDLEEAFPAATGQTESLFKWKDYLNEKDVASIRRCLDFLSENGQRETQSEQRFAGDLGLVRYSFD
jgi:hypothetical protein